MDGIKQLFGIQTVFTHPPQAAADPSGPLVKHKEPVAEYCRDDCWVHLQAAEEVAADLQQDLSRVKAAYAAPSN